jgi:chemotaxis protein methyltransferase CheR
VSKALNRIAELVWQEAGIVIGKPQLPALAAAIGRAAPGLDAERFLAEVAGRVGAARALARLIDEVTVQETYFLREPRELNEVDWVWLLERARASGSDTVRVWVSACATGEEAYSLAMLACEALGSGQPPVSILATDISTAAVERAEAARYSERSLRNVPVELRARYLIEDGSKATVRQSLRSLVRFRHHNLVRDPAPPLGELPFDVISCRNVLIYFDGPTVERVIGSLESALRPEGSLILGVADRLSGTAGRMARAPLAGPPAERRSTRPPRRDSRRPLGREVPRPRQTANGSEPIPASGPSGGASSVSRLDITPRRRTEDRIEDALTAANSGDHESATAIIGQVLELDPLNADAYFVRGLAELGLGESDAAARAFRRALYVDPSFGLAAFGLGRAHDARGDHKAARRAYQQALRTLDPHHERHRVVLDHVDLAHVAAACREELVSSRASPP